MKNDIAATTNRKSTKPKTTISKQEKERRAAAAQLRRKKWQDDHPPMDPVNSFLFGIFIWGIVAIGIGVPLYFWITAVIYLQDTIVPNSQLYLNQLACDIDPSRAAC